MITPLLSAIPGRTSIEFELSESLDCSPDSGVEAAGVDLRLRCDREDHERGRADAAVDRPPPAATSTRSKLAQALGPPRPEPRWSVGSQAAGPPPRASERRGASRPSPPAAKRRRARRQRPDATATRYGGPGSFAAALRLFRDPALALRLLLSLVSRHGHQSSAPGQRKTDPRVRAGRLRERRSSAP